MRTTMRGGVTAAHWFLVPAGEGSNPSPAAHQRSVGRAADALASSAKADGLDHYLELLDARELADDWTSADDVDATKPSPDLVAVAIDTAGGDDAVMVGDTPWACRAAAAAGVPTVAVMTGGFSEQELCDAGAVGVFAAIAELRASLAQTPLGAAPAGAA